MISETAMATARELIAGTFGPERSLAPEELPSSWSRRSRLGRNSWPLPTIRQLADWMLEYSDGRGRGAALEDSLAESLQLLPAAGFRLSRATIFASTRRGEIYASGLRFPNNVESEIQWWIMWGRVAGGMNRNQQTDIYQRLSQTLMPKQGKKAPRVNTSLLREMWRTAASLELLPIQTKTDLGEALIKRLESGEGGATELWCIARIGARQLFYGPINQVIPAITASRWVDALVAGEELGRSAGVNCASDRRQQPRSSAGYAQPRPASARNHKA